MISSSKFTYKIQPNARLKMVNYHGEQMYPLYLRIIFRRQSTWLKSNLFDQFEHPKHTLSDLGNNRGSSILKIIEEEEKAISFVIGKLEDSGEQSLELFKKNYEYYMRDVISLLEKPFTNFLVTFFQDEGYPDFAKMIQYSALQLKGENILLELKSLLKPAMYQKLLDNAIHYAPPYIPLSAFANQIRNNSLKILPVYILETSNQIKLKEFLLKHFEQYDFLQLKKYLNKCLTI